jgi:hypothetical protein
MASCCDIGKSMSHFGYMKIILKSKYSSRCVRLEYFSACGLKVVAFVG